jgi:hypothetical protein
MNKPTGRYELLPIGPTAEDWYQGFLNAKSPSTPPRHLQIAQSKSPNPNRPIQEPTQEDDERKHKDISDRHSKITYEYILLVTSRNKESYKNLPALSFLSAGIKFSNPKASCLPVFSITMIPHSRQRSNRGRGAEESWSGGQGRESSEVIGLIQSHKAKSHRVVRETIVSRQTLPVPKKQPCSRPKQSPQSQTETISYQHHRSQLDFVVV